MLQELPSNYQERDYEGDTETDTDDDECEMYASESEDDDRRGIVYLATAPRVNLVKVGYWKGEIKTLKSRYMTYYGEDVEIHPYRVSDCMQVERSFKVHFASKRLSSSSKKELFDKSCMHLYQRALSSTMSANCISA